MSRKSKADRNRRQPRPELGASTHSRHRRNWIAAAGVLAGLGVSVWFFFLRPRAVSLPTSAASSTGDQATALLRHFDDFAGSEACARCHQEQYEKWNNSTHGRAGGKPTERTVIARFNGEPLQFRDAVITPTRAANGDYVFVVDADGSPRSVIKVFATVGGGHMMGGGTQSFFQQMPDGTVRFLPFDFIRREGLWFVQLRRDKTWAPISKEISFREDLANWPPNRVLGTLTEFSNCQNCHGSQIAVAYDKADRRFDTRFQTLQINCESCHGPGRRHIEIVSKPGFEKTADIGMKALATLGKDQSLNVCFQCHATKDTIREEPYLPGARLEDYFSLKLPVFQESFTPDGRVKTFGYQSTHLYSDCYLNGSMTCVDCHEPHGQNYRDTVGNSLPSRFDNGQCTSCHASKGLAAQRHSHHQPDSPGNRCVGCHMPYLQHQGVGDHLMYARSDHSIPIPRPEFDQSVGIENACQKCHRDKDLAWQQGKVAEWYGELKPHHRTVANIMKAAQTPESAAAAALLLDPASNHRMAQMAGLVSFAKRFVRPGMDPFEPAVISKLKAFAASEDLDLKAMALASLQIGSRRESAVQSFVDNETRNLGSNEPAVKNRWAVIADYLGGEFAARGEMDPAIVCFQRSLEVKPDNVVTISHLALSHLRAGNTAAAVDALERGIKLRPEKAVLHFQLAQTYAQLQKVPEAVRELEQGLTFAPEDEAARAMLEQLRRP